MPNKIKKIAFCGLEEKKRSSLAKYVAHKLTAYCVPDYSKEFKKMVQRDIIALDYKKIGKGMLNLEKEYLLIAKKYLIYDNNIAQNFVEAQTYSDDLPDWVFENKPENIFDLFVITEEKESTFSKQMQSNILTAADTVIYAEQIDKDQLLNSIERMMDE